MAHNKILADNKEQKQDKTINKATDKLLAILREFQVIDTEFPLQYAICLLEISREEGRSLTHLADKTGMPLSTVSRIIGALSEHRQKGEPFGLVEVRTSKIERRRKELFLTPKGKTIVERLNLMMEK